MNITEFAEKHGNPCDEGWQWLRENNLTDMREIWLRDDLRPEWRLWIVTCPGVLSNKDARLFAVWCARQVRHLVVEQRSIDAINLAEKYANIEAPDEVLAALMDTARVATWVAVMEAAWAAGVDAASAASDSARDAVRAAARDAALDAAWKRQANECLRRWPNLFAEGTP